VRQRLWRLGHVNKGTVHTRPFIYRVRYRMTVWVMHCHGEFMPSFIPASSVGARALPRQCLHTAHKHARAHSPRHPHAQRGAAAVEFALVLPILLLVFFGIVELSLAMYNKTILTNASREGARAGIVLSSPKMTESQIRDVVLAYTNGALLSLGSSTPPTVTVAQSSPASFPYNLSVTVSYTYAGLGLGSMLGALGQPIVLTGHTTMVNE